MAHHAASGAGDLAGGDNVGRGHFREEHPGAGSDMGQPAADPVTAADRFTPALTALP